MFEKFFVSYHQIKSPPNSCQANSYSGASGPSFSQVQMTGKHYERSNSASSGSVSMGNSMMISVTQTRSSSHADHKTSSGMDSVMNMRQSETSLPTPVSQPPRQPASQSRFPNPNAPNFPGPSKYSSSNVGTSSSSSATFSSAQPPPQTTSHAGEHVVMIHVA